MKTAQQIFEEANQLSNMSGQNNLLNMIGEGDDLLHFRGQGSNIATQDLDQFTFVITNASVAIRTARLFCPMAKEYPSLLPGLVVTGAFNDVAGNAGLTGASGTSFALEMFQYYISKNPSRLVKLRVQSTVNTQLAYSILMDEVNPYRDVQNKQIYPQNVINGGTYNQNIAEFELNQQLDYLSDVTYQIAPSSSVNITFFMGTEINTAKALDKKYKKASAAYLAGGSKLQEQLQQTKAINALRG